MPAPVYRRAASNPRTVRELVFDRLPPAVRNRLTRGIGNGAPDALLAAPLGRGLLARRVALATLLASTGALVFLSLWGFGHVASDGAIQPAFFAPIYAGVFAGAALAAFFYVSERLRMRGA